MKTTITIILSVLIFGFSSCKKEDIAGKDLTILCEVLKPYNYQENGVLKGITVDAVTRILQDLNLDNSIGITTNWDSIYTLLQTRENTMVLTTVMTPERKPLFKWVGPITLWNNSFVGLKSSNLILTGIEDAKNVTAVGVVKGYDTGATLTSLGFNNVVQYNTLNELVQRLFDKSVDLIFDDLGTLQFNAAGQSLDATKITSLMTWNSAPAYLVFSKDVSDNLIKNWQEKLDLLKDNGFIQGLYDTYLPGTHAPGRILMFTEENPPQTYRDAAGNLAGSSMDMLNYMLKGSNLGGPVEYTNWTNAYNQILFVPNSMAFSTVRSTAREDLFQWVGPICKKRYCFYVASYSDYQIATIDDARKMRSIGTVAGWSSEQELADLGFNNVVTWATPQEVFKKLMDGDIPCAVLNDISMRMLGDAAGHPPKDYRKGAILSEGQNYLAFSKDTDPAYITTMTNAYNQMVSSGKLAEIWKGWYPDIIW
jgi:polar amino acid transport system substrate-binding protein